MRTFTHKNVLRSNESERNKQLNIVKHMRKLSYDIFSNKYCKTQYSLFNGSEQSRLPKNYAR